MEAVLRIRYLAAVHDGEIHIGAGWVCLNYSA